MSGSRFVDSDSVFKARRHGKVNWQKFKARAEWRRRGHSSHGDCVTRGQRSDGGEQVGDCRPCFHKVKVTREEF